MTQTVLTFISKVKPDQADRLKQLLDQIGDDPENNVYVPFRSLKLLHFASLVLHQSPQTPEYGPYLVFENNFDGELNDYLEDLYLHSSPDFTRSTPRAWTTRSPARLTARASLIT